MRCTQCTYWSCDSLTLARYVDVCPLVLITEVAWGGGGGGRWASMLRPGHLGYPNVIVECFCSVMLLHIQVIGMWLLHSKKECVVLTCTHGLLCPIK